MTAGGTATRPVDRNVRHGRNVLAGFLMGVGTVAMVDEVVFHQLLHWHHFYDRSTTAAGLVSDGLFHAFSWFATVLALLLVGGVRREKAFWGTAFAGGWLTGAGLFQLYDGLVQHKLMGLHQIRYEVDLAPYDLVWNVAAGVLLAAGVVLWFRTARQVPDGGRART